jgi:hypothetical protein
MPGQGLAGSNLQSIAIDASYGNGQFLQWLMDRGITPYIPTRDAVGRIKSPFYGLATDQVLETRF